MCHQENIFDSTTGLGEVTAVPGRPIPVAQLADADALMVRSVTKVNESLDRKSVV